MCIFVAGRIIQDAVHQTDLFGA
ncbi:MAG: hypothetical protein RIS81_667, partial [Actinomycetota bacterium]